MAAPHLSATLHRRRRPLGKDYVPTSAISPWARLPRPGIHPRSDEATSLYLAAIAAHALQDGHGRAY